MRKHKTMFAASLVLVLLLALFTPAGTFAATNSDTPIPLGAAAEKQTQNAAIDVPDNLVGMPLAQGEELGKLNQSGRAPRSPVSATSVFQGILSAEGEMTYLTFTLGNAYSVQATLDCPADPNVDYTLYLFEVVNGGLGQAVDVSNFDTKINSNGKTLSEMLNYINFTPYTQEYALVVIASKGYSTTLPFTLTVSLDYAGYMDVYEESDNPLYEAVGIHGHKITTHTYP